MSWYAVPPSAFNPSKWVSGAGSVRIYRLDPEAGTFDGRVSVSQGFFAWM